jgi:rhamnulokinase
MWAIQSIKRELENKYGYQELMYLAIDEKDFDSTVDLNDERFLAPDSMINTIKDYCRETGQKVPENVGQVMNVVYRSLAGIYKDTIVKMEEVTGKTFDTINIVGGGSKDEYLNTLTKNYTGKRVIAGPTEGTAVGNLLSQAISSGEVKDMKDGRKIVANSFKVKEI